MPLEDESRYFLVILRRFLEDEIIFIGSDMKSYGLTKIPIYLMKGNGEVNMLTPKIDYSLYNRDKGLTSMSSSIK